MKKIFFLFLIACCVFLVGYFSVFVMNAFHSSQNENEITSPLLSYFFIGVQIVISWFLVVQVCRLMMDFRGALKW